MAPFFDNHYQSPSDHGRMQSASKQENTTKNTLAHWNDTHIIHSGFSFERTISVSWSSAISRLLIWPRLITEQLGIYDRTTRHNNVRQITTNHKAPDSTVFYCLNCFLLPLSVALVSLLKSDHAVISGHVGHYRRHHDLLNGSVVIDGGASIKIVGNYQKRWWQTNRDASSVAVDWWSFGSFGIGSN
jgi:hypothetical protein